MRPCWNCSSPLRKHSVPPAGLEPALASTSGRCRRRWATGEEVSRPGWIRTSDLRDVSAASTPGCSTELSQVGEAGIEPAWWAHETPLEPPPVHSPGKSVGPAGVEPAFHRVSTVASPLGFGPLRSALYGNRTRLTCSTGRPSHQLRHRAVESVRRESHPPAPPWRGGAFAARPRTQSKDGRIRTLSGGFGGRLLSQEHILNERKEQDSNLQGLSPRPHSRRVPSPIGSSLRRQLPRQDSNLHPSR